jgi:uncharacterized protein involved in exopolysaccharide biosynthesis
MARVTLDRLEAALKETETQLAAADAQVSFLSEEIQQHPRSITAETRRAQNQAIQFMKPRILELELERSDLLTHYAPGSLRVKDIDQQLGDARRLIRHEPVTLAEVTTAVNPTHQRLEMDLAQAKSQVASASARVAALREAATAAQEQLQRLDSVSIEQERLAQSVADAKGAFVTYTKKEEEARLSSALDESRFVNIAVAQPATVPLSPKSGHRFLTLLLGVMLSGAIGVAVAFVRDWIDPAVKSSVEAQGLTGLPVLAEI